MPVIRTIICMPPACLKNNYINAHFYYTHLYSSPGRTFTGELSTFTQGLEQDGGVPSNTIGSSRVPVNITTIAVDTLEPLSLVDS